MAADGALGGAVVEHAFEQGLREKGDLGVEDLAGFGSEVGDDVAVGIAYGIEHPGVEVDAVVGEDGVGAGHVNGRGGVGADGDRGRAARGGDAGGAAEGGDVLIADLLRQADGGDVERVGDGLGGGDHAGIFAPFKVAGVIRLAVKHEVAGIVIEPGEGGEGAVAELLAVDAGVVGAA